MSAALVAMKRGSCLDWPLRPGHLELTTGVDSGMTVNAWVLEAVEAGGPKGMTLREVQRFIDERHYEELAIDTLEAALAELLAAEQLTSEDGRYHPAKRTSKEDAMRKLFGDV